MSLLNLVGLITLAAVLTIGLVVRGWLKRYLHRIDGVMGLSSQNAKERDLYLQDEN